MGEVKKIAGLLCHEEQTSRKYYQAANSLDDDICAALVLKKNQRTLRRQSMQDTVVSIHMSS